LDEDGEKLYDPYGVYCAVSICLETAVRINDEQLAISWLDGKIIDFKITREELLLKEFNIER